MQRLSAKNIEKRKREAQLGRAITEGIRLEAEAAIKRVKDHQDAQQAKLSSLEAPYAPAEPIMLTEAETEALRVANNRAILQTGAGRMDPIALRNLRRKRESERGKTKQAAASEAIKAKVEDPSFRSNVPPAE